MWRPGNNSMSKILVIGDIMLDRFVFGDVHRLSQEAPVPVVRFTRDDYRIGAAANVAANCASLGAPVTLIGFTGNDDCADIIFDLLKGANINAFILTDPSIKTTQKLRVIGRSQQIVRVDFEQRPNASITAKAIEQIALHDVIVLSDYDKGALVDVRLMIQHAKKLGKTVIVDPKGYDYSKYSGADLVKPNIDEMLKMAGGWTDEDQLKAKAEKLRQDAGIGAILLTRAGDGMTLYDGGMHHIHAKAKEVYDVTGAGDTVMAAFSVMLSHGRTLLEAAVIANYAAGVVVGKFGTATVSIDELREAMNGTHESNQ